ncbi:MAG: hypothetical protein K2X81_17530, partial [Candidatus Obscuribacterales bacterium]|nr:hypothetical protein [Candidatus Obscuribacterales bacterium]
MSPLPLKINLPMQSLKNHLRVFSEASGVSPDEWAATETSLVKIGDVFTMFKPAKVYAEGDDLSELEVAAVALVFREDAGFPMNYLIEGSMYEMSFMEGVLSSKATEAKDQGLAFYCFHSTLAKALTADSGTALGGMHKWGGSGDRSKAPQGLPDPLYFFLTSLGIAVDPTTSKEPLPVNEFVLSLWNHAELPLQSKAPKVAELFTPLEGVGLLGGSAPASNGAAAPASATTIAPVQAAVEAKPVVENKPANEFGALSLSALLDDWATPAKQEDAAVEETAPGNGSHVTAPAEATSNAQPEDGKLSELLGKMASISTPSNDAAAKPANTPASNNPFAKASATDAGSSSPASTPAVSAASNNPFATVLPSAAAPLPAEQSTAQSTNSASASSEATATADNAAPAKSGDATSGLFGDDDDDSLELAKL